jgi:hypothetical protein
VDRYRLRSREVEASRITNLRPLVIHGDYVPKSAGVLLVLEDHSTLSWQAGVGAIPELGSWVIQWCYGQLR